MNILNIIYKIYEFFELNVVHRIHMNTGIEIFDMLLLGLTFYVAIKFIHDRRAMRLLYGLGLLVFIFVICDLSDVKGMNLIFGEFYQMGFLAILIMFQPEIRSGLETLGKVSNITNYISKTNNNKSYSYMQDSIDIIAQTAVDLSNEKTGALMVIERETKLGEYIKTGTLINAQPSAQLLKNIFYNKAPLHDGAVIFRAFRIYSAGCYLPLSSQENIDENLGTRHRAGLGITEVSDSVVVIVSEETGKISIAVDGNIISGLNYRALKKELSTLLLPRVKKSEIKKINNNIPKNKEESNE